MDERLTTTAALARGGVAGNELTRRVPVWVDGVLVGRTDFGWEDRGVLGEFDGMVKYGALVRPGESPADALAREKARQDRLRAARWLVSRWVCKDLSTPDHLAARGARRIARGPGRPSA